MFRKLFSLSNGALFVALALSTIAAWYSIVGLTAIFAGAVVPIIIMGTALEFAKITTTVWLRKYWHRCSIIMKIYLVPAVVALAVLTSMGIFGFLSKAHLDQNIGSGDVQAQVSLLDEKIATQRETIRSSKAMLAQMDQQVNDIMTKGDSEKSVERSVVIRKQQAKERASLQKDIEVANKEIQKLNEERAPIASEMRKVEAEVGPIKYIAALIYGDNPDANVLERAVRWVIILLVVVFDPLAIMLVLAANQSKDWDENDDVEQENKLREQVEHEQVMADIQPIYVTDVGEKPTPEELKEIEEDFTDINHELAEAAVVNETIIEEPKVEEPIDELSVFEKHPYLNTPFVHFTDMKPLVSRIEEPKYEQDDGPLTEEQVEQLKESVELFKERLVEEDQAAMSIVPPEELAIETRPFTEEEVKALDEPTILTLGVDDVERPGDYVTPPVIETVVEEVKQDDTPAFEGVKVGDEWVQTGPALPEEKPKPAPAILPTTPYKKLAGGYVEFEGKRMHERVLRDTRPDLFLKEDNPRSIAITFGAGLPNQANLGDMHISTDALPHNVFKFNGTKWVQINKLVSSSYLGNTEYLQHLMDKISTGEYDPEHLTDAEQDAITALINKA
jgi:flagellar basal body-associated protein FliL